MPLHVSKSGFIRIIHALGEVCSNRMRCGAATALIIKKAAGTKSSTLLRGMHKSSVSQGQQGLYCRQKRLSPNHPLWPSPFFASSIILSMLVFSASFTACADVWAWRLINAPSPSPRD